MHIDGDDDLEVIEQPEIVDEQDEAEHPDDEEVIDVRFGDESEGGETGDEPEEEDASNLVNTLRKRLREEQKARKALEQQQQAKAEPEAETLRTKPTLESSDFDAEAFERDLDAWKEEERAFNQKKSKAQEEQQAQQEAWNQKIARFEEEKATIRAPDLEDVTDFMNETFTEVQRALIIDVADKPAILAYAIGKHPAKAKELAAITSHTQFVKALTKMELNMTVGSRSSGGPGPERRMSGNRPTSGAGGDKALERLEAAAAKSGDRTEVIAYKRRLAAKGAK